MNSDLDRFIESLETHLKRRKKRYAEKSKTGTITDNVISHAVSTSVNEILECIKIAKHDIKV